MMGKNIKICPKCGSNDLSFDSMSGGEFSLNNGELNDYCRNCGYGRGIYGALFPEIEKSKISEFRKELKKHPKKRGKKIAMKVNKKAINYFAILFLLLILTQMAIPLPISIIIILILIFLNHKYTK